MSGHVFIAAGDLNHLACDAVLLPTSQSCQVEPYWYELFRDRPVDGGRQPRKGQRHRLDGPPPGWRWNGLRTWNLGRLEGRPDAPVRIATNVGTRHPPPDWYAEGARQYLTTALSTVEERPTITRARPLLAMPLIGTGRGGAAREAGDIIQGLLPTLWRFAEQDGADVVLVCDTAAKYTAAQWARRAYLQDSQWEEHAKQLPHHLRTKAKQLGEQAARGSLVLFVGAGVSMAAGLPGWSALIESLAARAGLDADTARELRRLDPTDQARIVLRRLASHDPPLTLREALRAALPSGRYGLTHSLLASLPVGQVVTTNYDDLFERAAMDSKRACAVLPYQRLQEGQRWILKLHGSLEHAQADDDLVLTREDYLRFPERRGGALAGIVQAMLITKQMLFVGFSLTDPNFHKIADEVARALVPAGASIGTLGTALTLHPDALRADLWPAQVETVTMVDRPSEHDIGELPEGERPLARLDAARDLEIFLDIVGAVAARDSYLHLLDPDFGGVLDQEQRQIGEALLGLEKAIPRGAKASPAWAPVQRLLDSMRSS